ncbi:uncharacterized protein LOC110443508 isoform X2 [Mizuhopecten yessoensis]|nr:uncharacterized protein LOC110443508 isoform X2 [Mizuhopecten yessoensis]
MCETLQKSLDTLRQSYSDSLEEKDRIIALLDARLTEVSGGESLLPKLKLRFSTPKKQDEAKAVSIRPSSRKQSPDSTMRTTPLKDRDMVSVSSDVSGPGGQNKGTKLCLSRGQKRHRYTAETISPDQKRQKIAKRNDSSGGKKEHILVPETCDLYNQSNVSAGSEIVSLDDSLRSPNVYRKRDQGGGQRQGGETGGNVEEVCATDIQIIPETVNFFDAYPSSSEEEEEEEEICTQSTIKRAPSQNYSLRSVLCSPPSSDGEDCPTDMRNVVSRRTMQLSGQSVVMETEEEKRCERRVAKTISDGINVTSNSRSQVSGRCVQQNESITCKGSQREKDSDKCTRSNRDRKQDGPSKQDDMFLSVKPFKRETLLLAQEKLVNGKQNSREERKSTRTSQKTNLQTNSHCQSPSALLQSPITKVGGVQEDSIESPSLLQGSKTEEVGEEPESPSILRGSNLMDDDITIIDSPRSSLKEKTSKRAEELCFKEKLDQVDEDESPCILRSKTRMNSRGSSLSVVSFEPLIPNSKSPKKKALKLGKGSKVELVTSNDDSLSSRQLRQTTLSQVFNNSPPRRRKKKTDSQEEEDLQKAIQLSLRDTERPSSYRIGGDVTEEDVEDTTKENTPPFKKPVIPSKKNRSRHCSSESPLKRAAWTDKGSSMLSGQRSPGKRSSMVHDQRSPGKGSSFVQSQRSPGKGSSIVHGQRSPYKGSTILRGQMSNVIDLDETMSPDSARLEKQSEHKSYFGKKKLSSVDCDALSRNGSMDPNVHLSVLCDEDSELILEKVPTRKQLSFHKQEGAGIKESASVEFDFDEIHVPSLNDSVATLRDFRIDDLEHGDNETESRRLTSTCIDEDSQSIPCSSRSVKFGSRKKRAIVTTGYTLEDTKEKDPGKSEEEQEHVARLNDSFDKVPDKAESKYAFVGVVRKQNERRNLIGYECKECYEYYSAMGLGEEEIKERVQSCSKHRAHYVPPQTPPHFWSIGFPDTQECEERGYLNKEEDMDECDIRPAFRRRRKLKKIFKSKDESEEEENVSDSGS